MARIPQDVIDRLKTDISLVRLVERAGVELKRQGKDWAGRCPFHDDDTPSLIVSEIKNVFHCFGCEASGTVIDWVMKTERVSFPHAVEILQNDLPVLSGASSPPSRRTRVDALPPDHDDQQLLNHVIDFYHDTLKQNAEALAWLDKRGLGDREIIERFKLGLANRTLGYRLPSRDYKEGNELRQQLQRIGLYRKTGHEHFNGCIVFPIFDEQNNVVEVYGRKLLPKNKLKPGAPQHLYLPGPHRGIFNLDAFNDTDEIILCEAVIDALTFWRAGYKNVTASYGVNGFTDDLLTAFNAHDIKRVLIAYDRDDAGDKAAHELAERLNAEGIDAYRIQFPKGMDANEYALNVQPAEQSLGVVIRSAEWMGSGRKAEDRQPQTVKPDTANAKQRFEQQLRNVAAQLKHIEQPVQKTESSPVVNLPAAVIPDAPKAIDAEVADHEVNLHFGDRRYRVRGFEKNTSFEVMRVNILVVCRDRMHVDSLDLYSAKARQGFIKQAAAELEVDDAVIKKDLGQVLLKLELMQEDKIRQRETAERPAVVDVADDERREALELLQHPDLLDRIIDDVRRCGLVGEANNSLAGYLACVSRKLDGPLAIIVQSTSAAGKSSLMDAVLAMMPDEDRVQYSAMTGQSLFYMGETNLKHKILAIAEEEGAAQASYALKLLQSEGELTIASTGKDPQTGRLETQEYRVEGPVMLFLTTTAIEIDDELLNRCLVLTINESREQTQAIHQLQRRKRTLEGLLQKYDKKRILTVHRNAQRLLKPLDVLNPYAERLTFLDDKTRTRRDHEKYLTLIDSIALLHQYQREIKTTQRDRDTIQYVEVTLGDIETANRLAHEILGRTLDELPPQTRRLLKLIYQMVRDDCERQSIAQSDYRFSRKQIRDYSQWGDTQLRVHLERLVSMEYLLVHRGQRGQSYVYELLYDGQGDGGETFLPGLIDIEALKAPKKPGTAQGSRGADPGFAGSLRPQRGANAAGLRRGKNGKTNGASETYEKSSDLTAKSAYPVQETQPTYPES